jgi:hypothetical protein
MNACRDRPPTEQSDCLGWINRAKSIAFRSGHLLLVIEVAQEALERARLSSSSASNWIR